MGTGVARRTERFRSLRRWLIRKLPSVADHPGETTRRDFIYIASAVGTAAGGALFAWPLIDQMNPSAAVLALASIEVDLAPIQAGQVVTVMWRGKPLFIRHRTPNEIAEAKAVPVADLLDEDARNANLKGTDPATDKNRATKPEWLIVAGNCTHLGCVPLAHKGAFGGWLCPCHGSEYDTAGRVRKGPAPENLPVPPYTFLSATRVKIG
jgi:ubiquinol-cytochrome c reductase iron-sulfur subunit